MYSGSFDAIVVGAGIVGAACAMELTRCGLKVAICESDIVGGGATAAGMGHLTVMDDSEEQFALTHYSQLLWRKLAEELPADAEFLPCGALWIAADAEEMAEVRRKHEFYTTRGLRAEVFDSRQLAEAEPSLRAGLAGGLFVPGDSVCYPPCVARHLLRQAAQHGAVLFQPARITEVTAAGACLANGDVLASKIVVIATGAQAGELIPNLPLRSRKGHLLITDRYPGLVHHQLIELGYLKSAHAVQSDSVAFNVQPRATGQLLIGSSRQFASEETTVEQRMLAQMLRRAVEYIPMLPQVSAIRAWTGHRAATPDKLPLIGPCPNRPNVYLATGHEGLGISTSLATARLLADHILGRESAIPIAPYLPDRSCVHNA
jgi:glycine/D-amino acid oxidase-like deaminating enzyme